MNRYRRALVLSLLLLIFLPHSAGAQIFGFGQEDPLLKHPRELRFPEISFTPPKPARTVLPNGMILYLLEDPELPLIRLSALIRTGSMYDPSRLSGLAQVTAQVLRNGGTLDRSPRAVNEALESMGALIEFSMERESGRASLSARKQDFPLALSIFAGLLMKPAFDPVQVDLAKRQEIESIRRSNDRPDEIASREFRRALFAGNPRGQVPTIESITAIKREDLAEFHRSFFQPNNLMLAVSGDFKKEEMVARLEESFRGWPRALMETPFIPLPSAREQKGIYQVQKDLAQSTLILGHLSIPIDHPDAIPLQMVNFILGGGGFNSRLMREIRSNQGLAYSVGSFYSGQAGYGILGVSCRTKSATTHRVISLINEIMEDLKKKKPTQEELEWAQKSLLNQFIFSFTSSASIAHQRMQLEYDGLPEDYLEQVPKRISAVNLEDLGRVAGTYLLPEKALLLVVGNEGAFEKPLSDFGLVNRIELPRDR